jgi:DNA-binding response OmpR family regulator
MESSLERMTALVVEDDPDLADLYAAWLRQVGCTVHVARSRAGAFDLVDEHEDGLDLVVLDRRLGDGSGDDVLDYLRAVHPAARAVMLTGVSPDLDILDMPFNEYLVKPVTQSEFTATVLEVVARSRYVSHVDELYVALRKLTLLQSNRSETELLEDPEYLALLDEVESLRVEADRAFSSLGSPTAVFRELAHR